MQISAKMDRRLRLRRRVGNDVRKISAGARISTLDNQAALSETYNAERELTNDEMAQSNRQYRKSLRKQNPPRYAHHSSTPHQPLEAFSFSEFRDDRKKRLKQELQERRQQQLNEFYMYLKHQWTLLRKNITNNIPSVADIQQQILRLRETLLQHPFPDDVKQSIAHAYAHHVKNKFWNYWHQLRTKGMDPELEVALKSTWVEDVNALVELVKLYPEDNSYYEYFIQRQESYFSWGYPQESWQEEEDKLMQRLTDHNRGCLRAMHAQEKQKQLQQLEHHRNMARNRDLATIDYYQSN